MTAVGVRVVVRWDDLVDQHARQMSPDQAREFMANHIARTNGLAELVKNEDTPPEAHAGGLEGYEAWVRAALRVITGEVSRRLEVAGVNPERVLRRTSSFISDRTG
jgi:hypothetical protein